MKGQFITDWLFSNFGLKNWLPETQLFYSQQIPTRNQLMCFSVLNCYHQAAKLERWQQPGAYFAETWLHGQNTVVGHMKRGSVWPRNDAEAVRFVLYYWIELILYLGSIIPMMGKLKCIYSLYHWSTQIQPRVRSYAVKSHRCTQCNYSKETLLVQQEKGWKNTVIFIILYRETQIQGTFLPLRCSW